MTERETVTECWHSQRKRGNMELIPITDAEELELALARELNSDQSIVRRDTLNILRDLWYDGRMQAAVINGKLAFKTGDLVSVQGSVQDSQ